MLTTSLTFLVLVLRTIDSHRCLTTLEEVNPKRLMMMNGEAVNIRLEVSQRITHRLTSHITKIFLEEVVGYAGVTLVRKDDHEYLRSDKIYKRLSDSLANGSGATVPDTMVNMEVWIPPQEDTLPLLNKYNVKECGSIGPPGHLSWFIPRTLAKSKDISWLTFGDREASKCFDVQEDEQWVMWRIRNATYDRDTGGHYCEEGCKDGMYVPERCREDSCALLLAAYPGSTGFVKDDIDTLKLYVKVAWVGPHLKDLTDFLTERYNRKKDSGVSSKSLVILHWTPSALISDQRDFVAVNFPRCGSLDSNVGCAYESHRLTKVVWGRLETAAKFAFQTITRIKFTREMYRQLLRRYNEVAKNSSDEQVSCSWLRENLDYALSHWKLNYSDKKKLYVGGIFPMSGSVYTAKSIAIAAKLAKEAINANNSLLRDYNLNLLASDGQCKSDMVMKSFIDYIFNHYYENLVGVLGPACSETVEPLIGVSKHYRTVVISYSAEGSSFNDRSRYPYFFRTIGENKEYRNVYLALLQRLGWRRIASLTEDGQKYTEYISYMEEVLRDNGIAFVANAKFPKERDAEAITKSLQDLKRKRAKIIIADVDDRVARQVMCEAYRLGMTAVEGYVWFLPLWLRARWYDTDRYNAMQGEQVACSTADMSKAINGHLALSHAYFAADDEVMQEGITVRQWRDRYEKECRKQKEEPSNYAAYAYDAMWTYAYAIERLIRENHSYLLDLHSSRTVQRFTEIISASDFAGLSGRIKFYGGPSRYSIVNIVQHVDNETRIVGNFYPDALVEEKGRVKGGRLRLNVSALVWLSGAQPDDGSESPTTNCPLGYVAQLLEVSCEVAIVIVNVIGFALLGALLVFAFVAVKRRYDEKVRMHHKYMISLGLDLGQLDTATLDKWEIPRNRVVINRKIGEGAFGTVYGGEAFFPENGWVAVAVKTLKVGSSIDEKSDFLSEFEVMKRFEHKNIIRLLGVCLQCEPVLTVMEFMLYGDLKTYLLARRHLVNDRKYEDSDEISNKKLTAMALDVARALSYLAQLKYVHRDVASRNCLVNAQRVVKLGDFGMTRPMYENDYYRFNRKGMLPVRWMAPESLALGVFSAASDVWSYGVLLYEIVTFGSFPFQGMSNNEVLVHVKAGNCLVVPKGVKAPLENLMYSCWCVKQNGRPTAPEIVEFLATNPRILSPCLDVPLASVQLEHTGQMEMHLSEHMRKFSSEWPKEALPAHYQHHPATPLLPREDASSMEEGYTARRSEQMFHKYVNVRADYAITNSSYNPDVADEEDVRTEERTSMIAKTNDDEAFSDLG